MHECKIMLTDRSKWFLGLSNDNLDRKHLRRAGIESKGILVYNLKFWTPVSESAEVFSHRSMCRTELVSDSAPQIASMLHLWYVSGVGFCHLFGTDAG